MVACYEATEQITFTFDPISVQSNWLVHQALRICTQNHSAANEGNMKSQWGNKVFFGKHIW